MRLLMCAIIVWIPFAASAQNVPSQANSFRVSFNHLALAVEDLDRAEGFYSHVLRLEEITTRRNDSTVRWFSLRDGKELHLILTKQSVDEKPKEVHLAVNTQNFDLFVTYLKKEKIRFSDWAGTAGNINLRSDGSGKFICRIRTATGLK